MKTIIYRSFLILMSLLLFVATANANEPETNNSETRAFTVSLGEDRAISAGSEITLTATITPFDPDENYNYYWRKDGVLMSETNSSIPVSPNATTNYSVTVERTSDWQHNSATIEIAVFDLGPDKTICLGGGIRLIIPAITGATYLWSNGDTRRYTDVSPTETTPYTLTVTKNGYSASDEVTVFVIQPPDLGNGMEICRGISVPLDATIASGIAYSWNNGATSPLISVPPNITTTYSVVVTTTAGCTVSSSVEITVNQPPTVNLGPDKTICNGESELLSVTHVDGQTYLWSTGEETPSIPVSPTTTTSYTLTVTDANGCSASDEIKVFVNPSPTVNLGDDREICSGTSTRLEVPNVVGQTYLWSPGGETTRFIDVSPITTTTYTLTVTANGCSTSDDVKVTVNPLPVVDLGGNQTICSGEPVTLSVAHVAGQDYLWSTGETKNSITVLPTTSTSYWVTVTTASGCSASDNITINVNPAPIFTIDDKVICRGESVTLNAPVSAIFSYLWNTGATTPSIPVSPTTTTTYSVEVTNTTNGCATTEMVTVTVNPVPTVNLGGDRESCVGTPHSFTAPSGTNYEYEWFLNGVLQATTTQTFSVDMPATQTELKLTVTDATTGCSASDDLLLKPYATPEVDLGGDLSTCAGIPMTLEGPHGTGYSYKWYVNDMLQGTSREYTFIPITSPTIVRLEVTGPAPNRCVGTDFITVYILDSPVFDLGSTISTCEGETFTLHGPVPAVGDTYYYKWYANNVLVTTATSATYDHTAIEDVWIKLEVTPLSGCVAKDSVFVEVADMISANLPATLSGCTNSDVVLQAPTGVGYSYQWYVNNQLQPTIISSFTINSATPSVFNVRVVISTQNGCEGEGNSVVTIYQTPDFEFESELESCYEEEIPFTGPVGTNLSYEWFVNNVLQSTTISSFDLIVTENAKVKLRVTNTVTGCWHSDSTQVTMLESPIIEDFPTTMTSCIGETITLNAPLGTGYIYKWYVNNNLIPNNTAVLNLEVETNTSVKLIVEAPSGCSDEATVAIQAYQIPVFSLGEDEETCYNETITFSPTPALMGVSYEWFVNNVLQSTTISSFDLIVTENAKVKLRVTNTVTGCSHSDSTQVTMRESPIIEDFPTTMAGCIGETITLEAPIGTGYTYQWYVNNTLIPNNTAILNLEIETYTVVRLVVEAASGCSDEATVAIQAYETPLFDLGESEIDACIGNVLSFTPTISGNDLTYNWFVNDELFATAPFLYLPIDETIFKVKLEVTANVSGCVVSDSVMITPREVPEFSLPEDMEICKGYLVALEAPESEDYIYSWKIGNNYYSDATLIFEAEENVEVTLQITSIYGCYAVDTINITVLPSPQMEVMPDSVGVCFGSSVELSYTGMYGDSYTWFNGSTAQTITFEPTVIDTTYYLWAEAVHYNGCTARDTAIIRVLKDVDVDLLSTSGYNGTCIGGSVEIKATTTGCFDGEFIVWDNVDTVYFNGQTTLYRTYTPQVNMWAKAKIVSNDGCFERDSLFITVVQPPVITFVDTPGAICLGDAVTIQAQGAFYYTWYTNGQPLAEGHRVTLSPTETTTYQVVGQTADPYLCEGTAEITIAVLPPPVVEITSNYDPICYGQDIVLTASGADTYQWNTGSSWYQLYVRATETTLFEVIGTNAAGCTDTTTFLMEVLPAPETSFTGILPVYCLNDVASPLIGTPVGGNFYGPGISDTLFNPMLAGEGTHTINYIFISENGCQTGQSVTTNVFGDATTIDIGNDLTRCPGDSLTIEAIAGFDKYYWSTGDTTQILRTLLSSSDYERDSTYQISLIGVLRGCTAYGTMNLIIDASCPSGPGFEDYFTNHQLSIVPNPTKGIATITTNENDPIIAIEVYDIRGSKILSQVFDETNYSHTLDLSTERNKLLIIRALTKDYSYYGKLIVE